MRAYPNDLGSSLGDRVGTSNKARVIVESTLASNLFKGQINVPMDKYLSSGMTVENKVCILFKNIWRNQRTRKLRFVNFWISFRGTFHRECMAFLLT